MVDVDTLYSTVFLTGAAAPSTVQTVITVGALALFAPHNLSDTLAGGEVITEGVIIAPPIEQAANLQSGAFSLTSSLLFSSLPLALYLL